MDKLLCWLLGHDWTSAAMEGKRPKDLPEVAMLLREGREIAAFLRYKRIYCKRCGKQVFDLEELAE